MLRPAHAAVVVAAAALRHLVLVAVHEGLQFLILLDEVRLLSLRAIVVRLSVLLQQVLRQVRRHHLLEILRVRLYVEHGDLLVAHDRLYIRFVAALLAVFLPFNVRITVLFRILHNSLKLRLWALVCALPIPLMLYRRMHGPLLLRSLPLVHSLLHAALVLDFVLLGGD